MLDPAGLTLPPTTAIELALDDPRIAPLLAHSDSAHIFPGDPGDRALGRRGRRRPARGGGGPGHASDPGAAHLVSVCTDPRYRGRRLAREACLGIMRAAVAEGAPMLVLEMYAANEAGRRAYGALGFTEAGPVLLGAAAP